jgi:dihydrofolate reductase
MRGTLSADNAVAGRRSYEKFYSCPGVVAEENFVLTRRAGFRLKAGCQVCHDDVELANRLKDSAHELVLIGGLQTLKLFALYAQTVHVAETNELVPGDRVCDG